MSVLLYDLLDAPTALAACCGFDLQKVFGWPRANGEHSARRCSCSSCRRINNNRARAATTLSAAGAAVVRKRTQRRGTTHQQRTQRLSLGCGRRGRAGLRTVPSGGALVVGRWCSVNDSLLGRAFAGTWRRQSFTCAQYKCVPLLVQSCPLLSLRDSCRVTISPF